MLLFTVQKQFFHSFHGCPAFSAGLFFFISGLRSEVSGMPVEGQENLRFKIGYYIRSLTDLQLADPQIHNS